MAYFANIDPRSGPILGRHRLVAIGDLQAPDDHSPIGMALEGGWDEAGVAVRRLIVHGAEVPGLCVVVDREFRPAR